MYRMIFFVFGVIGVVLSLDMVVVVVVVTRGGEECDCVFVLFLFFLEEVFDDDNGVV